MTTTRITFATVLAGMSALIATGAQASGFNIWEQGAKASAMAGAFVARADDASANWYNPAALVWLEDREIQFGTNLITAGSETDITSSDARFGLFTSTRFEPESSLETPSHFYANGKIGKRWAWGVGLNNPFGLVTEWVDRPITFSAQKSELVTFYLNGNIAWRLSPTWSVAAGLSFVDAEIKEFSREVPIDVDGNPLNGFEVIGRSNLTGEGDEIGWNVALHKKTQGWSFGVTYRSELTVGIDGNVAFENFGPLSQIFQTSPGTADLDLPPVAAIGLSWKGGRGWDYEFNVGWIGWSDFESIEVDIRNNVPGFVEDIDLREDWDDTFSYRFGGSYRTRGPHEWRFGAIFDEGAVPEDTLRPSIPDADRRSVTAGYGYHGNRWNFDLYYMALFFDDIDAVGSEEGVIRATYSSFVHLAGVTLRRRF